MNVFRFAWRNLWRNRRRTIVTVTAVSLTAAIIIASYSLMDGLMWHTVSNITNMMMGEAQIHQEKYLVDRSMYRDVKEPDRILAALEKQGVPAAARSYGYGLAAQETKSAGAMFWGVDPSREKTVFDLAGHMAKGSFLTDEAQKGVVLGKKLARSLNADVGSEIVVVVQAADGSLGNELYTVTGILKTAGDSVDRMAAILHQADFEELFVSNSRVHEIAINTRGHMILEQVAAAASAAAPEAEVKTWRQLAPAFSDMLNLFDASMWIFGMIFFLAGGLGIMNTMLMATFERIREFGVLKALGATPWRILMDVAAEALVLAVVSSIIGAAIGLAASYYLQVVGIDTRVFASGDISMAGIAFDPVWRAAISFKTVVPPIIVMCIVSVLASLYPAAIAARLNPVKAIGHV